MNLTKLVAEAGKFVKANAPTILSMLGCAGVVGTAIVSAKTARSVDLKKVEIYERDADIPEKSKAMVKEVLPLYLPLAATILGTMACIFGSDTISSNRVQMLSNGLLSSILINRAYRDKVREEIGPEKEQELYEKTLAELPASTDEVVEFFDPLLQYRFRTTWLHFMQAQYELNRFMLSREGDVRLSDFYRNIPEIKLSDIPERAKHYGWNYDMFLDSSNYWIDYGLVPLVSDKEKIYKMSWYLGPVNLEYDDEDLGPWETANEQIIFD